MKFYSLLSGGISGWWASIEDAMADATINTIIGISSAVSSLGNIGPGLGKIIGPLGSYDSLHDFSKIIITLDMYIGRLELIPFLVLFQKSIWNLHK